MSEQQNHKNYEVNFITDKLEHAFYINCPDSTDATTFAHAVFHYYDIPPEWGKKQGITKLVEIDFEDCIPEYLHIVMQDKKEIPMLEENEESHRAVRKVIKQMIDEESFPMAIYDQEKKIMTVYSTRKMEVAPRAGLSGNVLDFG